MKTQYDWTDAIFKAAIKADVEANTKNLRRLLLAIKGSFKANMTDKYVHRAVEDLDEEGYKGASFLVRAIAGETAASRYVDGNRISLAVIPMAVASKYTGSSLKKKLLSGIEDLYHYTGTSLLESGVLSVPPVIVPVLFSPELVPHSMAEKSHLISNIARFYADADVACATSTWCEQDGECEHVKKGDSTLYFIVVGVVQPDVPTTALSFDVDDSPSSNMTFILSKWATDLSAHLNSKIEDIGLITLGTLSSLEDGLAQSLRVVNKNILEYSLSQHVINDVRVGMMVKATEDGICLRLGFHSGTTFTGDECILSSDPGNDLRLIAHLLEDMGVNETHISMNRHIYETNEADGKELYPTFWGTMREEGYLDSDAEDFDGRLDVQIQAPSRLLH
jgi:hypothetical protein